MSSSCITLVFVIGMHRSGTSVVARLANLLGMNISRSLISSDSNNEQGYWEPIEIVNLNEKILSSLKSSWFDPSPLPIERLLTCAEGQLGVRATEILLKELSGGNKWVFKDPRFCRLFPFWHAILKKIGIEPSILIPCRHPEEVAASLFKRDKIPIEMGLHIWIVNTLEAEFYTRGLRRSFVSYDSILNDWKTTMRGAGEEIGLDWSRPSYQVNSAVMSYLKKELCHHRREANLKNSEHGRLSWSIYKKLVSSSNSLIELDAARKKIMRWNAIYEPSLSWLVSNAMEKQKLKDEIKLMQNKVLENELRGKLIEFIHSVLLYSNDRKILIWGSGTGGSRTFQLLQEFGIAPSAFIDSDHKKWGKYLMGYQINSAEETLSLFHESYVVIGSMYFNEIVIELEKRNLSREVDYVINPLLKLKSMQLYKLLNSETRINSCGHMRI